MPLVDWEIERKSTEEGLISPFDPGQLSSMGYDLTLSSVFREPIKDAEQQVVDPFNPPEFRTKISPNGIIIPAHEFILGCSVERISLPDNLIGICLGRSSYARAGIITHVTPLEPGWIGYVTIEITNTNPLPVRIVVGKEEGITQVVFFQSEQIPNRSYASKGGRYQFQEGITQGRPKVQKKDTLEEIARRKG